MDGFAVFADIDLARPGFLWLAAVLPLFWWWWRAGSRTVMLVRSLLVLLLILSLAEPQRVAETYERSEPSARIFAFDLSRSIQPATRRWMLERARAIAATPGRDRFFVFAGRALEVENWEEWLERKDVDPTLEAGKTNLAALLAQLSDTNSAAETLYLFTDGWETAGTVRNELPLLRQGPVRIVPVVAPGKQEARNVRVDRIVTTREGDSREAVRLKVSLHNMNGEPVKGKLVWTRDGRSWKTDAVVLEPGYQLRSYEAVLPEEGLVGFQATFVPENSDRDVFEEDNRATAWISVKPKEQVLIVNGGSNRGRYLEAVLRRQGFKVTAVDAPSKPPPPDGFAAVIFNDLPRRRVSDGYMKRLREYVRRGGSFIMLGGNGSFGPGGYRNTPVDEILPVELEEPKKRQRRTRGIVLVIDKSGSMRTDRKLAYAKEAASVLAQNLKNRDLLGVVGFDVTPFEVLPLRSMAQHANRVSSEVARLKPGGKTYLYPALLLAKRMLERSPANLRHVIVLSDGETGGSGSDYIDLAAVMKQDLNISVSSVAIGDQANVPLLKRLSLYGGGAFHHTYDPSTLPRIVASEVRDEPDERVPEQKVFEPRVARGTEILKDFPEKTLPSVTGFIPTKTRKGATGDVLMRVSDGVWKPLVASWRYGRGKVVALTTDQHGGWTRSWIRWRRLDSFWNHILEWVAPRPEGAPMHEVRIDSTREGTVMDLYVYGVERSGNFRYRVKGVAGDGIGQLEYLAPGHYRARLPIENPGVYRIELVESRDGKDLSYPPIGYTQSHDPAAEIPRDEANVETLEFLARATGSQVNGRAEMTFPRETLVRSTQSLQMVPILAAAALFLLEIFLRRWLLH